MTVEGTSLDHKRVCYACGSSDTWTDKLGKAHWYGNLPIGWLCERCENKFIKNPKYHPRLFWFVDKQVIADEVPRVGVCSLCRAVLGEINAQTGRLCKQTHIHHWSYHTDDPLRDTLEVCNRCHTLSHWHQFHSYR